MNTFVQPSKHHNKCSASCTSANPITRSARFHTSRPNFSSQKTAFTDHLYRHREQSIPNQYAPRDLRKIHRLETKQFSHKPPVQIHTTNNRIPIKLVDENYIALIDTGSDICTIPETILLQDDNLRRLPRFKSNISEATTAAANNSVYFKYTVFPRFTIGNYTVTNKFYVAQNSDNDIILEIPFLRQTRAHLDFGSEVCTLTLNNAVTTESSTTIPPHSTVKVLCSPRTSQMNKGPVLISSRVRNKYQSKLFVPDIYTEIDTLNKPVFKIPISNKTGKHVILPKQLRVGFVIFLHRENHSPRDNHRENIPKRPCTNSPPTDLIKSVCMLNPTTHKSDKCPQATFPILEHSLSSDSTLTPQEKQKLLELLKEFDDVFLHPGQKLSCTNIVEQHLGIPKDTPVWPCRSLRLNNTRMAILEECVKDLLHQGIIQHSDSPYSNPIVLVTKKNGSIRPCLDCRTLNEKIPPVTVNPRPVNDILASIPPGSKYFSTFDLTSAYFQLPLAEEDRKYTAFDSGRGKMEYCRAVMGCKVSSSTLVTAINKLFHDMIHTEIHYFLDDGLIASPTFEQHLVTLRKMFERLRKAKLMLGHKKCSFGTSSTEFLGHKLSSSGISPSVDKLRAVKNFPQPKTAKQVKSFIGLGSYCRRFIPGFSQIAHSLYELTKQNMPFDWTNDCETAFQTLKNKLCTAPVLISPDPNLPFHIFSDASKKSVGFVLMQKKNGRLHPIAYGSKILDKHQQNWTITCLEAYALVIGLHHFRFYVEGHKVILHTDHSALTYIAKQHLTDTKVARWLQTLINFDIQIIYEKASNNTVADVLSRNVDENNAIPFSTITENWLEEKFDQFCPPLTKTITTNRTKNSSTQTDQFPVYITQNKLNSKPAISKLSLSMDSISDRNDLINAQRSDPYFAPIINFLERGELTGQDRLDRRIIIESEWFHLENFILYRTSLTHYCKNRSRHQVVLCIPENLMLQAIIQTHNVGHLGITKLYLQLRQQYYSPKLRQMVRDVVQTCAQCELVKPLPPSHKKPIKMTRLPAPYSSYSMDLFGPLSVQSDHFKPPFSYVLVIKELWSGWISLTPLCETTTEKIADQDPTNDAHYYSNVVKRVMEDKRISIDIYQQIHDDYCKTQEDSKNRGRKVIPLAINQPVYLKIFHPSTEKSAKLQPLWKGPFYIESFKGNSGVYLSKQIGQPPLATVFHRDFVKPFITRLVQSQTTPILQPTQINPKDWLALDLDHIEFYSDNENTPNRKAQTQNPPPVKPPGFQLKTPTGKTTDISNGQLTDKQTDKRPRNPKPDLSENTVGFSKTPIPSTPDQRSNANAENIVDKETKTSLDQNPDLPTLIGKKYFGKDLYLQYKPDPQSDRIKWVRVSDLTKDHIHVVNLEAIPFITRSGHTTKQRPL